jgi:very-short-patch-repair endonuclease
MFSSLLPMLFFLALALVAVAVLKNLSKGNSSKTEPLPVKLEFRSKRYFFSQAERQFFLSLQTMIAPLPMVVMSKVRLNDLIEADGENKRSMNNRINGMHVDFVLLSQPEFKPLLVIELDGSSHLGEIQQTRDTKKDAALKIAGLPLVRLPNGISSTQMKAALEPYLFAGIPQISDEAERIRQTVAARSKKAQA